MGTEQELRNWLKKEIEYFCSVNGCAIEGISQKLNLSRNTVYMWHQGKSFPNVKQLAAFMDLLEIGAIIP